MENIKYSFTDSFLDDSADNFSFGQRKEGTLSNTVKKLAEELGRKIADIVQEHNVTVEKISKLLTSHINYKRSCEVSFSNALIWAKALEVNTAQPPGSKYSLMQHHQMVAKDPALQNLNNEAKMHLKDELQQHQSEKGMGVCATNATATQDVHATVDHIIRDLDGLAMQMGIYATLFVTRGHSYNMHSAMWYGTDNAMDFWEDVLKLEPDQVAKQFELWGYITQQDSLENMQRECLHLIETNFCQLVGNQTQLNYNNFNSAIKLKHGIDKKGWPETIPFTSPCNIANIKLIWQL
ncbi:hypothetical protein SCLCIDRAFT_27562 [Scleroderma citrinum Foug A]|uniref:Uncharacterized protein n=1 Tax=Scleroderma citrinum Foug A TaxID=1036808 RepID=A0A0C3A389_9AGAM|nr:hypothetical protein SCLCIDRAFT_27562 [Scleroderma citrinum Foug A]